MSTTKSPSGSSTSDSSSKQTEQTLTAASNVHFALDDVYLAFNNGIALLQSKIPLYKDLLLFLSNSCISKALTIQPSAMYTKYLKEFWYTAKVENNKITFSLSHVKKPLTFDRYLFSSIIGLDYAKEYVPLPTHEEVKEGLATLGLIDDKRPKWTSDELS
ncbi:hypothetical protein Tco_0389885 [Tanacetum coccineum]